MRRMMVERFLSRFVPRRLGELHRQRGLRRMKNSLQCHLRTALEQGRIQPWAISVLPPRWLRRSRCAHAARGSMWRNLIFSRR